MIQDPPAGSPPWGGDAEFNKITSPLASNEALNEMLQAFEEDEVWKDNGARADQLADYLSLRSQLNGFDAWDFEAAFFNDSRIRRLYESDRESLMTEWMIEDLDIMVEAIATAESDSNAYTRNELRNLADILEHLDDDRAAGGLKRIGRILDEGNLSGS